MSDKFKLIKFQKSKTRGKKYDAIIEEKLTKRRMRIPFGAIGYEQYRDDTGLKLYTRYDHLDRERRKNYLKRVVSNDLQIKAFEMVADKKYTTVANSIIGMPDENRDLIFDTINLVRKLPKSIDATGAFIFAPYHGTALRDVAIQKGYIKDEDICSVSNTANESMLNMPTISKKEISGLNRTFSFSLLVFILPMATKCISFRMALFICLTQ